MTTFVLVHGMFCGGWSWQRVARELRGRGHDAYHPSLDGCGDRKGSARPGISLDTHGGEIAQLLFYEDLHDVVLVGTSLGGMVIMRAAELARERVAQLVFVDAIVPLSGESLHSLRGEKVDTRQLESGKALYESRTAPSTHFPDLGPQDHAWAVERFTQHPLLPVVAPVDLRDFWSRSWSAHVLMFGASPNPARDHQERAAQKLKASWTILEGAGHYAMLTHPCEIADYLTSLPTPSAAKGGR